MKSKISFFIITIVVLSLIITILFPSPLHNDYYDTLSEEEKMLYNDYFEQHEPIINEEYIELQNQDWFAFMDSYFTKFELVARVIDCHTLKEYFVTRVGGYNHADVETLTYEDTAIFKSLYNNEWSWVRRPVWIEINGVFFAASINGMPHSYYYNEDNGEYGHTCIHFLNSKTHGTKRVDEAHQNAVAYAFEHYDDLVNYLNSY